TEKDLRIEAQQARHDSEQAREAAVASDQQSRHALTEMYTSYGLGAAERNDPGQGVLWFAQAARLAGAGTAEEQANRTRIDAWSRQALQPIRALPHAEQTLRSIVFHPDSPYLLTQTGRAPRNGGETESILWDLVRETPLSWPAGIRKASSAAWSPDGRQLALGTPEGEIALCGFPAGDVVRRISCGGPVRQLLFSPEGHYLAIACEKTARVWNCRAEAFATPKLEHPRLVTSLAFSPRGQRLATGCQDGMARVFPIPTTTGEPLFLPVRH